MMYLHLQKLKDETVYFQWFKEITETIFQITVFGRLIFDCF